MDKLDTDIIGTYEWLAITRGGGVGGYRARVRSLKIGKPRRATCTRS